MTSNENNDFERKIKSSLEAYEVDYNPADWSEMEGRLTALPVRSSGFEWSFTMNIYVAVAISTVLFFLIYTLSGPSHVTVIEHRVPGFLTKVSDQLQIPADPPAVHPEHNAPVIPAKDTLIPQNPVTGTSAPVAAVAGQKPVYQANKVETLKQEGGGASGNTDTEAKVTLPDDASRIHIFGDMIDPKQGMIYNTKENISGIPLNNQTKTGINWMDDGKKSNADSLKSILSPEVKESNTADGKKADKKSRKLFHARNTSASPSSPGAGTESNAGPAQQASTPEPNKDDKAPADMPQ